MPANVEVAYLGGTAYRFTGGSGDDIILGNGDLSNVINGGDGNDQIYGGALTDTLRGGAGDDAFLGRGGGDTLIGGTGNDLYVIGDAADVAVELSGEGTDVALVVCESWVVAAHVEVVYLSGAGTTLIAGDGAQILVGNGALVSNLFGGGGNDILYGTIYADVLSGGEGDDILSVGGGADRLVFDIAAANGGFGHDSVFGLSLGATFDFRGSGLAGKEDLTFTDLGGAIRVTCAAGVIDFYAAPLSAIQDMNMMF
jgi:serralysin